jgi:L-threonylcarbamoyladenylate synthase
LRICKESDAECFEELVEELYVGWLAVVPTDTVYGLVADARIAGAVEAIYETKGKGTRAPLQLLFGADESLISSCARLTKPAEDLISGLGPGGWTIIVPVRPGWTSPALAGGATVGVRIPDSPLIQRLVKRLDSPLAASSANLHGDPSPRTIEEAWKSLIHGPVGLEPIMLGIDAGPTPEGIDSTVIDCSTNDIRILREGAIDRHTVARILGLSEIPVLRSVRQ